ncbi:hypothetical protein DFQ28_002093 [Apophysomyces sp. BC1034]|nr:hypothetical protein DFQ30_010322 [Apophysomyces sp. BC1015]KAG0193984.1 hypothetical protein DFQ28_002093 [Apophysomyces sp. BC1034]
MILATSQRRHRLPCEKWRKGLALFSKLSCSQKKENEKPLTVRAAATEKIVRRRPCPSPGIHSEDLTASQFANITGIKIKKVGKYADGFFDLQADSSDDDDDDDDDDEEDKDEENDNGNDENEEPVVMTTTTIYSAPTSTSGSRAKLPRIWESNFWQRNNNNNSRYCPATSFSSSSSNPLSSDGGFTLLSTSSTEASTMSLSPPNNETPYISLLRHQSARERPTNPSIIQKGRFKIVIGQDDDLTIDKPIITPEKHCVEWKRKRSCTT